jgi:hypothetical protein
MRKQSLPLAAPLRLRITLTLVATCTVAVAMALPLTAMAPTSARSTRAPAVTIPGEPRYTTFQSPPGVGDDAGEPSIGVNYTTETSFANSGGSIPNGGTVTYFGGFLPYMLKVTFDDCPSPALATWEQKALLTAGTTRVLGDPILFTDHTTGRTFVSQLVGGTPLGSTTEYTDNDGETFNESEGSGLPSCVDHQTYGGGPFHTPLTSPLYPRAVYYASQCISNATCSISLDGGVTFGPGVTMFTIADCVGLHGHLKVGPDGTIYVPNKGCGGNLPLHDSGNQAVIESEDNGVTWSVRPIPTSTSLGLDQTWDPSVAIATDGTVYFAYRAADGSAHTAVSSDKGLTWEHDTDVGAELGIKKCAFPAIVAGDPDRSAFAFYGCTTDGDDGAAEYPGVWYLYIATTFDGGQTWHTINVTPGDPVQRGGICGDGDCRNMLDFFGADIDKEGRVLVGWDDVASADARAARPIHSRPRRRSRDNRVVAACTRRSILSSPLRRVRRCSRAIAPMPSFISPGVRLTTAARTSPPISCIATKTAGRSPWLPPSPARRTSTSSMRTPMRTGSPPPIRRAKGHTAANSRRRRPPPRPRAWSPASWCRAM